MATATKNQVFVGNPVTSVGAIQSAALGTELPERATAELAAAFERGGLIGEDGVSENTSRGSNPVKAWGGSTAIVVQDEFSVEYKFTWLETNEYTLKRVHGEDNVIDISEDADSALQELKIILNKDQLPEESYVIDIKHGDVKIRIVIPVGQITEIDEVTYSHKDATAYAVTITCYEDDEGNNAYKYLARPRRRTGGSGSGGAGAQALQAGASTGSAARHASADESAEE